MSQSRFFSLAIYALISFFSFFGVSFAQSDAITGHYAEEKTAGDLVAATSRRAFELAVCKQSLHQFCPSENSNYAELSACEAQAKNCGAPETQVVHRFISKYGWGAESANQVALPAIAKVLSVLSEGAAQARRDSSLLSPRIAARVAFLAKLTGQSKSAVTEKLLRFMSELSLAPHLTLTVDYWGYFQQFSPLRQEWTKLPTGAMRLSVSFRWCGEAFRFVDESSRLVGEVLAAAITDNQDLPGLATADQYKSECRRLQSAFALPDQLAVGLK